MAKHENITAEELRAILHYDPESGIWTWLVERPHIRPGDRAGSRLPGGYRRIKIDGIAYYEHTLAFLYVNGAFPKKRVDHRNRIRDDNRWANFREATNSQNKANSGPNRNNTVGIKGVYRSGRRFMAQVRAAGNLSYAGTYSTIEEAEAAHVAAHKAAFGEFSETRK